MFVLRKQIISVRVSGVKNTLLDFGKLHLMCSIDCGNVINTFSADIWCAFVCV